MTERSRAKTLRVALTIPWNTLHPGLQHTLAGDLILSNQFEALIGRNSRGLLVPLAAKSWEISEDFRRYVFRIDRNRRFSNGDYLEARDFKNAWETAVALEPVSSNSSLGDVLYKLRGFSTRTKDGGIQGLKVVDAETLELEFESPFRQALEHLSGNRFAVYKILDDRFVGTGMYQIDALEDNHAYFSNNPYSLKSEPLEVLYLPPAEALDDLTAGRIDAIHYLTGLTPTVSRADNPLFEVIPGPESTNLALYLNTTDSSLFSDVDNRRALQTLVFDVVKQHRHLLPSNKYFTVDFQFFLPIQAGRLTESELESEIEKGRQFVPRFLALTRSRPVKILTSKVYEGYIEILRKTGIEISNDSAALASPEYFKQAYAKTGPDLYIQGFSVAAGDPDANYHVLGKNGAIRLHTNFSPSVANLMEEGRNIKDVNSLDEHYRKVSFELAREVPMIHLGFAKALSLYRKDTVQVDENAILRNQGQMHYLRAR